MTQNRNENAPKYAGHKQKTSQVCNYIQKVTKIICNKFKSKENFKIDVSKIKYSEGLAPRFVSL